MNDYRLLAVKYLKLSKKRTVRTIIGAFMGVMLLYTILNIAYSAIVGQRTYIRSTDNYELVVVASDSSLYDQIIADDEVLDAYVGQFSQGSSSPNGYTNLVEVDNALYIHIGHPYFMNKYEKQLKEKYDIDVYFNDELAATYLQGEGGEVWAVLISMVLLISMIIAIFSVGMVRDAIQLSTLEQIKDYGNLKCIGASKGQIRAIIYSEGFIIETIAIILGVMIGFIVDAGIIKLLNYVCFLPFDIPVIFSLVPIVPVCIAFYGDLYFVMQENYKLISNMSPIAALKGEFRIKKEKVKIVKGDIFGKIFGIEGAYAYKNLRRNPARFRKAVWSMGFVIASMIFVLLYIQLIYEYGYSYINNYKYYNVYEYSAGAFWNKTSNMQSELSFDFLNKLNELDGMEEAANIYLNSMTIVDYKDYVDHLNPKMWGGESELSYYTKVQTRMWGITPDYMKNKYVETFPDKEYIDYSNRYSNIVLAGYEQKDIQKLQKNLVEGTLDVSDHGIVLVNHGKYDYLESVDSGWENIAVDDDFTYYKVGDTITFFDQKKYRERVQEAAENAKINYINETGSAKLPEEELVYAQYDSPQYRAILQFWRDVINIQKEMRENGEVKEYTIEGIISEDLLFTDEGGYLYKIIVPLDNYYDMTGLTENDFVGRMYHFKSINSDKYYGLREASRQEDKTDKEFEVAGIYKMESVYVDFIDSLKADAAFIVCVVCVMLFIMVMICINIANISASNIYLRRREFSQLRVIGMSKKSITKMVCLEGFIASVFANAIGLIIGPTAAIYLNELTFKDLYGRSMIVSAFVVVVVMIVSTAVEIGSLYFPTKNLGNSMADDLKQSGE